MIGLWLVELSFLALATTAAAAPARAKLLADFFAVAPLEDWSLRQVEAVPLTEGMQWRYLARGRWRRRWPSAALALGKGGFDEEDWTRYDRLVIQLQGDPHHPALLKLRLDDRKGQRAIRAFVLPAGQESQCVVPIAELAAGFDATQVVRLDLYMSQPAVDYALVLREIRLEADSLSLDRAELFGDPFGAGQVRIEAQQGRPVHWQVQVRDEKGEIVARGEAQGSWLAWNWRGGAPGRYRVELAAEDAWGLRAVREWKGFEIQAEDRRSTLGLWVEPATRQVMLHTRPRRGQPFVTWEALEAGAAPPLRLEMARNETEGIQVVFLARRDSAKFDLALEGLRHAETGKSFPLGGREIYQVGYVLTRRPESYAVDFVGWWPDPLLPVEEMQVAPEECMPVWISLRSRPDTRPGIYRGRVQIRREGGRTAFLPLEVQVWDGVVPDSSSLRTAFSLYEEMLARVHGREKAAVLRPRYREFVADHRLNVDHLYRTSPPSVDELLPLAAAGRLNAFNLLYVRAADRGRLEELAALLDPVVQELRERGLADQAYIYGFDEAEADQFAALRQVFGFLKGRYPEVRTATTARDPSLGIASGLDPVVDIWVPLTAYFDSAAARAAQRRGDEVWWYLCQSPTHPFANWFVEYPVIEARLLGWMAFRQQVTGLLYYALNRWPAQEAVMRLDGNNKTNWNPASFGTANGDGSLFYAGPEGPISTMRLENLRDGLEDFELLGQLGREQGAALVSRLIRSLTDYSRDAEVFAQVRRQLLEELAARADKPTGRRQQEVVR